jgi:hypothetical protein
LHACLEDYFGDEYMQIVVETEALEEEPRTFGEIAKPTGNFGTRLVCTQLYKI